jgi:hypothetical protein
MYFVSTYTGDFDGFQYGGFLTETPTVGQFFEYVERSDEGSMFFEERSRADGSKWYVRVSREWGLANPSKVKRFYPMFCG